MDAFARERFETAYYRQADAVVGELLQDLAGYSCLQVEEIGRDLFLVQYQGVVSTEIDVAQEIYPVLAIGQEQFFSDEFRYFPVTQCVYVCLSLDS